MSEQAQSDLPAEINVLFSKLSPLDVEQFYRSYQLWTAQQQISALQAQLRALQLQKAENDERMQQVHPSAIALATLASLQSHGVSDTDLLDRMLERGELWLDQTMQRLTYCEQLDFISNNYTEWCEHALDGAYDWIDSLYENGAPSAAEDTQPTGAAPTSTTNALGEATEEILLQKLMTEDAEDEAFLLETTLKRPAVVATEPEDAVAEELEPLTADEQLALEPTAPSSEDALLPGTLTQTEAAPLTELPGVSSDELAEVVSNQPVVESVSQQTAAVETSARSHTDDPGEHDEFMPAECSTEDIEQQEAAPLPPSPQRAELLTSVSRAPRKRNFLHRLLAVFQKR